MLLYEILGGSTSTRPRITDLLDRHIDLIREHCSVFLRESGDCPVYKSITQEAPFVKLKARKRKANNAFSRVFNEAFDVYTPQLRQRAVYAHGAITETAHSQYYLFPTDGFKFIYNPSIVDSSVYEHVYDKVSDDQLISQLLFEQYCNSNLVEAIKSGSEILFFNTPHCYAVNTRSVRCYDDLLALINHSQ